MHTDDNKIIPLTETDLPQILALEKLLQQFPWTPEILSEEFESPRAFHFGEVQLHSPGLRAYFLGRIIFDELHINRLCTLPDYRRHGHAHSLLVFACAEARSRGATRALLEVDAKNEAALSLYRKAGFAVDAVRKKYYPSGNDACMMSLKL
ncbi:MAG: GNAT family N-acetyltransferase [Chitinispirillaceae bacterium]|jgi:ribosomal protein S18 acetylase RimI-like enzyme|nr:GNAT family N-acetyltransferase [Chitinispirillaceae bacterium]